MPKYQIQCRKCGSTTDANDDKVPKKVAFEIRGSCYKDGRQVLFAGRISASMLTAGRVRHEKDSQE